MSPYLPYEIARVRQQEIAARALHPDHAREIRWIAGPSHPVSQRISHTVGALGGRLAAALPLSSARTQIRTH